MRKAKSIKQGKKRSSRRGRIRVIYVKVEIASNDELRGGGDEIFKKDRKFSLSVRMTRMRRTVNDK